MVRPEVFVWLKNRQLVQTEVCKTGQHRNDDQENHRLQSSTTVSSDACDSSLTYVVGLDRSQRNKCTFFEFDDVLSISGPSFWENRQLFCFPSSA